MSLKRILGTMLASRMGGRGRRGGSMGSAAMMSGLGRRRSGMGGKMGLAAMGFMAYRAYKDHQSRTAGSASASTAGSTSSSSSGSSGGIADMIKDVVDRVSGSSGSQSSGPSSAASAPEDDGMQEEARAAENFSEDTALLLIRAMVTAAYSDGSLSNDERERIMGQIDEAGGTAEDRAVMEREIANPKPLDTLLADVDDQETAEEFYLASRVAVDGETEANRTYLDDLRRRLNLSEAQVSEVEEMTA